MKFPFFVKYSVSKNSAALSGSAMGRQQRSSRENRWNTQGNSIRRNTSGNSRPKRWGQVLKALTDGTKLLLAIDRKPIAEWFKEQFDKLRQSIYHPMQLRRKGREAINVKSRPIYRKKCGVPFVVYRTFSIFVIIQDKERDKHFKIMDYHYKEDVKNHAN